MNFIHKDRTSLIVIDMQDRLMNAIPDESRSNATKNSQILIEAAKTLELPIIVTEQYPKGLGPTITAIKETVGDGFKPIEKVVFSCARSDGFKKELGETNRDEVLICGIETHVCVLQTVMDLVNEGYKVYVAADAVTSRKKLDWEMGIKQIEKAGGIVGTSEIFIFQLLERAGTDEFKRVSRLLK